MSDTLKNLGTTIKKIREAKNIKQIALQEALQSSGNISKIEANKQQLQLATFYEIIDLLNISIEEFFIIHSAQQQAPLTSNKKFADYLNQQAPRITQNYLKQIKTQLSVYQKTSFSNITTLKDKLLFHKVSCFYYLNFKKDKQKAAYHSRILLDYYKRTVNIPLLSELELLPMILPFTSTIEGSRLLNDFRFFQNLLANEQSNIHNIHIRSHLSFAKKCLTEGDVYHLMEALETLTLSIIHQPNSEFYCDFLLLKGVLLFQFEKQTDEGIALIQQGLKEARELHLFNLYENWITYLKKNEILAL